ncbi:hypothetical protein UFOVP1616_7 [uncultured Caudovirales phage]|uniref:Uncharacterized protein n=1 Tax=uncultured Caudovirales phage TaxID=2100421 RepID=A0A6J5SXB6_9CAUD|nr:hypothetical protein UFOVP1467_23 [uncultured Caudovirales phage]CAB4219626.1 hypothetical protein UFOVP1616_7 [uncultured Caudovirales phage]
MTHLLLQLTLGVLIGAVAPIKGRRIWPYWLLACFIGWWTLLVLLFVGQRAPRIPTLPHWLLVWWGGRIIAKQAKRNLKDLGVM